jgi:DNA (cytosine-5)-methyltransferase 1
MPMVSSNPPLSLVQQRPNGASFASVYCGCGGLDLGFARAGYSLVWANDRDPVAVETHNQLLGHRAIAGPIDEVAWPIRGSADVVVGGPPCQGFSVAGKMNVNDPRSRHVLRFLDFVEHVSPRAFVMENVKALAENARWEDVRRTLRRRAKQLGFKTELIVLHAANFGVPQRRERMFLIGVRESAPPREIATVTPVWRTVREAFAELPPFGQPGNATACTAGVTPAKRPILRPTPWRGSLLFNGNGRPLQLDAPAPTLPASMGGNATPIVDQHELESGQESWIVGYHKRLRDGGTPVLVAPTQLRRITVEEAAAIQSFPKSMTWHGSNSTKYRQIGNAVPPLLAFHVALALAAAIGVGQVEAAQPLAA